MFRLNPGPKSISPSPSHHHASLLPTGAHHTATMVLRIRLSRFGKKHAPFYNIVLTHARTARNSRPLEVLGTYNPIPQPPRPGDTHGRPWKDIKLDVSRARYWVGVGAQPSDTAWRLLSMVRESLVRSAASVWHRGQQESLKRDQVLSDAFTLGAQRSQKSSMGFGQGIADQRTGRHSRTAVPHLEDPGPGRQGRLGGEVVNTGDARHASRRS